MSSIMGVGVDIIEIERFRKVSGSKGGRFVANVFSKKEELYCRAFADPAPHFAGTFAAKEAAVKALGGKYHLSTLEVRRTKSGKPEIWKGGKRLPRLSVSISHADLYAAAVCIAA